MSQGETNETLGKSPQSLREMPSVADTRTRRIPRRENRGRRLPSPPNLDAYEEQDNDSIRRSYEALVGQLKDVSEQEGKDQVFRR